MEYNREVLVARVVELRDKHRMSFAMIADTMNAEGYTPRTAESFSGATVFQLYKDRKTKKVVAAS